MKNMSCPLTPVMAILDDLISRFNQVFELDLNALSLCSEFMLGSITNDICTNSVMYDYDDLVRIDSPITYEILDHIIDTQTINDFHIALCGTDERLKLIAIHWHRECRNQDIPEDVACVIDKYMRVNRVYWKDNDEEIDGHCFPRPQWREIEEFMDRQITKMASGEVHCLFLEQDGNVWSFGRDIVVHGSTDDLVWGLLGFGHSEENATTTVGLLDIMTVPRKIQYFQENDIKIVDIRCGRAHSLALDTNGRVYSWGSNMWGECGHDKNESIIEEPRLIESVKEHVIISIECGNRRSFYQNDRGDFFVVGYAKSQDSSTVRYR